MNRKTRKHEATVFEKTPEADAATQAAQDVPATDTAQQARSAPAPDTVAPAATDMPEVKPRRARARGKGSDPSSVGTTQDATAAPAPATAAPVPAESLTMAGLSGGYIAALEQRGAGLGTRFSYSIDLAIAVRHFGANTAVASLTARKVQNFFDSEVVNRTRAGKAKAKPTIDKTRRVLRLALEWAADQGLIAEAPLPPKAAKAPAA